MLSGKIAMKENNVSKSLISIKSLIKSAIMAILFTIILFLIFSLIISFTDITEASADTMVTIATIIGIIISGIISAYGAASKGWLSGSIGGLFYIFIVWLSGKISGYSVSFSKSTLLIIILSIVFGAIGGIIGINMKRK